MNAEDYIRKQIQKILFEGEEAPKQKEEEKPKPKPARGRGKFIAKYGSGRHSAAVAGSKARVETDPAGLLSDLGASAGEGDSDAEKILGLVRSAIYGTDVMSAAYVGANLTTRQDGSKQINIAIKALKPRDGVYFMSHVLTAAQNIGEIADLEQDATLEIGGGGLVITFS